MKSTTIIPFNKPYVSESGNTYHFKVSHARKQCSGTFPTLQDAWNYFGISKKFMLSESELDDVSRGGFGMLYLEDPVVDQHNFISVELRRAS